MTDTGRRYYIQKGEWYPVYTLLSPEGTPYFDEGSLELSDAEYADYTTTMSKFEEWQVKIWESTKEDTNRFLIRGETFKVGNDD